MKGIQIMELVNITEENLQEIIKEELGHPDDLKVGQIVNVPVVSVNKEANVFYGPLDFSGNSNNLSQEELYAFIEKKTGFRPETITQIKKSEDIHQMWIYAVASMSIGPCDAIALYPSIKKLVKDVVYRLSEDDEDLMESAQEIKTDEDAVEFCKEHFQHSFFTGEVYGPFEYVSGLKPNKFGCARG
jgi:hypothetical protein